MPRRDNVPCVENDHDAYLAPLLANKFELVEGRSSDEQTTMPDVITALVPADDTKQASDNQATVQQVPMMPAPVETTQASWDPIQSEAHGESACKTANITASSSPLQQSPPGTPSLPSSFSEANSPRSPFGQQSSCITPSPSPVPSHGRPKSRRRRLHKAVQGAPQRASRYTNQYLQVGSCFTGRQENGDRTYEVNVEIKTVDFEQSCLSGYLTIKNLIEGLPSMTTYFEGEIIGSKHGFKTKHEDWGASDRSDLKNWKSLAGFAPLAKQGKGLDCVYGEPERQELVFMRWKETFLVPDYTIKEIMGVSFDGLYYICFNQITGAINGVYFHLTSNGDQNLRLTPVYEHGAPPNFDLV